MDGVESVVVDTGGGCHVIVFSGMPLHQVILGRMQVLKMQKLLLRL